MTTSWKRLGVIVLSAAILMVAAICLTPPRALLRPLNAWNLFHYVLGGKYFDELGYFDLYPAALLADAEGKKVLSRSPHVRDLRTYRWVPTPRALAAARRAGLRARFSSARWAAFKGDLNMILELSPTTRWRDILRDRGFNPSPAWMAIHHPLLNRVDVRRPRTLALLCYSQLLLYVITFAAGLVAFGLRRSLVGAVWFVLYTGNWGLKVGGYFSFDWFCLVICAVALYRTGRPLAAGPPLALAAMMRGFPALLLLAPGISWVRRLARRRLPGQRQTRLLAAVLFCCLTLYGLGSLTGRGTAAWLEWKEKISIHVQHHKHAVAVVGFQHLFTHDYDSGKWVVSMQRREEVTRRAQAPYRAASLVMVALTLLAMVRRSEHDGMVLGVAAVFFSMMMSRYYFSVVILLFTLDDMERAGLASWLSTTWLFGLLAIHPLQHSLHRTPLRKQYFTFNAGVTIYFTAILGRFLARDLAWLRRRRAGGDQDHTAE